MSLSDLFHWNVIFNGVLTEIITPLFAAFFGAYAAFYLQRRRENKESLISISNALNMVFSFRANSINEVYDTYASGAKKAKCEYETILSSLVEGRNLVQIKTMGSYFVPLSLSAVIIDSEKLSSLSSEKDGIRIFYYIARMNSIAREISHNINLRNKWVDGITNNGTCPPVIDCPQGEFERFYNLPKKLDDNIEHKTMSYLWYARELDRCEKGIRDKISKQMERYGLKLSVHTAKFDDSIMPPESFIEDPMFKEGGRPCID